MNSRSASHHLAVRIIRVPQRSDDDYIHDFILTQSLDPIYIYIDSDGGSIHAAEEIALFMQMLPAVTDTISGKLVRGASVMIHAAGTGDRIVGQNCVITGLRMSKSKTAVPQAIGVKPLVNLLAPSTLKSVLSSSSQSGNHMERLLEEIMPAYWSMTPRPVVWKHLCRFSGRLDPHDNVARGLADFVHP